MIRLLGIRASNVSYISYIGRSQSRSPCGVKCFTLASEHTERASFARRMGCTHARTSTHRGRELRVKERSYSLCLRHSYRSPVEHGEHAPGTCCFSSRWHNRGAMPPTFVGHRMRRGRMRRVGDTRHQASIQSASSCCTMERKETERAQFRVLAALDER